MNNDYTHCYVITRRCGCAVGVCVDTGDKGIANFFREDVAPLVAQGAIVERMTIEQFKETIVLRFECPHVERQLELFE